MLPFQSVTAALVRIWERRKTIDKSDCSMIDSGSFAAKPARSVKIPIQHAPDFNKGIWSSPGLSAQDLVEAGGGEIWRYHRGLSRYFDGCMSSRGSFGSVTSISSIS